MNVLGWVAIKLYLWTWKFEFHIIFKCYKIFFKTFSTIYKRKSHSYFEAYIKADNLGER